MSYKEKFILFSKDNVEEIQDIIQAIFPEVQVVVVTMLGPVMKYLGHEIVAKSIKYNPLYGPFETVQLDVAKLEVLSLNKGLRLNSILMGLYGYYPASSMVRYGIKTF